MKERGERKKEEEVEEARMRWRGGRGTEGERAEPTEEATGADV